MLNLKRRFALVYIGVLRFRELKYDMIFDLYQTYFAVCWHIPESE